MASNSFLVKGWCVTIVAAVFALASADASSEYAKIVYVAVPLFWYIDAMYLSLERNYIKLYNDVAQGQKSSGDYSLKAESVAIKHFFSAAFSWSITPIYVLLLAANIWIQQ